MASARSRSPTSTVTEPPVREVARPSSARGVTGRAVLLGVVLIPPACWWLEYTECVSEGTDMAGISYVLPALFLLFLLVALNRPLRRWRPAWAFSPGELLTGFVMLSPRPTLGGPGGVEHP